MDNLSQGKRILIATVLAIAFFVVWNRFIMPTPEQLDAQQQVATNMTKQTASPKSELTPTASATSSATTTKTTKTLVNITSQHFQATIDEFGRISSWTLLDKKFKDKNGNSVNLFKAENSPLPLEVRFGDQKLNEEAFNVPYTITKNEVKNGVGTLVLSQKLSTTTLTKNITFKENGSFLLSITAPNATFFVTTGFRPDVLADQMAFYGTRIKKADGKFENIDDGDLKREEWFKGAFFASNTDRYYTTLFYNKNGLDLAVLPLKDSQVPFVSATSKLEVLGYIGDKDVEKLIAIDPDLKDVVEYGVFTFIAKYMFSLLNYIFGIVGNWGWAIVIMTLIMRIILFPLTYKGMVSMGKMKDIAPKMNEIREKYKGDTAKIQAHTMELYKKSGANPFSGCLPILLQIPIFFAVYRVLVNSIELKGAEWAMWITDLAQPDPYYVLPVLMGFLMYLQQRLTPTTLKDKTQEFIMKLLPVIFTIFFLWFQSGLTLYWCVNNLCSVLQQLAVNKMLARKKNEKKGES